MPSGLSVISLGMAFALRPSMPGLMIVTWPAGVSLPTPCAPSEIENQIVPLAASARSTRCRPRC